MAPSHGADTPAICLGGPRHRWVYLFGHLETLARSAARMGRSFDYQPTPGRDQFHRVIWRYTGPKDYRPPPSTYDASQAYWHST